MIMTSTSKKEMMMTEKRNLSVSEKFWIGIIITILGIIVSLFVPEVRCFLGIEKERKEVQEISDKTWAERHLEQEKLLREKTLETGNANTIEQAKNMIREKNKAESDKYWENLRLEQEIRLLEEAQKLLETGKANTIEEAKKMIQEKNKAESDKYWENFRLEQEIRLLEEAQKLLK